jgi:hypothetical protein
MPNEHDRSDQDKRRLVRARFLGAPLQGLPDYGRA